MSGSVGGIELIWTLVALVALILTIAIGIFCWTRFEIVRQGTHTGRAVAWGPRWNLMLGLLVAMVFFGTGWLGYLGIGLVAMWTPPPIREVNQDASNQMAAILIAMEFSHALAQLALMIALFSIAGSPAWVRKGVARWAPFLKGKRENASG